MLDPRTLEDMARRLVDGLPSGVRQLHSDLEKNAQIALQGALARLDLVTREEFEVQRAVLSRTRARLETLEARVLSLESYLKSGVSEPETTAPDPTASGASEEHEAPAPPPPDTL